MLNRILSAVAEGRITQIVPKRRCVDDGPEVRRMQPQRAESMPRTHLRADARSKRATNARDLQRVSEPSAREIIFRERKNLRLVLQAPECRRKDNAIAIALKIGARSFASSGFCASESFCAEELWPVHVKRMTDARL